MIIEQVEHIIIITLIITITLIIIIINMIYHHYHYYYHYLAGRADHYFYPHHYYHHYNLSSLSFLSRRSRGRFRYKSGLSRWDFLSFVFFFVSSFLFFICAVGGNVWLLIVNCTYNCYMDHFSTLYACKRNKYTNDTAASSTSNIKLSRNLMAVVDMRRPTKKWLAWILNNKHQNKVEMMPNKAFQMKEWKSFTLQI